MKHNTEREQYLDGAIDHCGIPSGQFENTDRCLRKVMSAIGARREDEDFVRERIAVRVRAQEIISNTDSFIDRTNAMLDRFEADEKEWERKGNALGFDFWN